MPQFYESPPPRLADETLIARAVGGDRRAFADLVARHYDFIFRTACKWCGKASDAEDVAQDVMVTLWRKAALFDPAKSTLSTWLYRIARNRWIDRLRRERSVFLSGCFHFETGRRRRSNCLANC